MTTTTSDDHQQFSSEGTSKVVYLGRIPHGFYEEEMKAYFSQFGEITHLRLSRNKKTGASKHYAFIEFKESKVAKIVAETMDKYLLYNTILQCKLVDESKVHPDIWKGANKLFKKIPRAAIAKKEHNKERTKDQEQKRLQRNRAKREKLQKKIKELNMDYEITTNKRTVRI